MMRGSYNFGLDVLGATPLPSRGLVLSLLAAKAVGAILFAVVLL